MAGRRRRRRQNSYGQSWIIAIVVLALLLAVAAFLVLGTGIRGKLASVLSSFRPGGNVSETTGAVGRNSGETAVVRRDPEAEEAFVQYIELLNADDYSGMYQMLDSGTKKKVNELDFIDRNQKIYSGIEAHDFAVTLQDPVAGLNGPAEEGVRVYFTQTMQTLAGELVFDNSAVMVRENDGWKLAWTDSCIFPDLTSVDTVRISSTPSTRGSIYDRNGVLLAGMGTATSVGVVRGKMAEDTVSRLAEILSLTPESINNKLNAKWVTDDVFVPIKTVEALTEQEKMSSSKSPEVLEKQIRNDNLLAVPGVQLQDTTVRVYPLGEAAAHLVGYVQSITADELAADHEGFYTTSSQIGRVGLESLFEDRLRGTPGRKIRIISDTGDTKKILATSTPVNGEDITITIDSTLQRLIYEGNRYEKSTTTAINPLTGEVLALVSTPSYDNNLFILGVPQDTWDDWNNDPAKPLVNRFRAIWTPGSSFKPVTAAIGITEGTLDPGKNYGSEESWQLDESWGGYRGTTIHSASPAKLEQALIVSDNVYFAKAATALGADLLEKNLIKIGFGESMPFAIRMSTSSFSNTEHIESTVQLADSGYGQGQIQINPLHLLSIYTAFMNQGNMIQPCLELAYANEKTYWKEGVFSEDACERVNKALKKVVSDSEGTGHKAYLSDLELAGKTGTAEIKESQDDIFGTELGWFTAYTTDREEADSFMMTMMVEDVKDRGGSGYVVEKCRDIFDIWCLQGRSAAEAVIAEEDAAFNHAENNGLSEPYDIEEADPDMVPDPFGEGWDEEDWAVFDENSDQNWFDFGEEDEGEWDEEDWETFGEN